MFAVNQSELQVPRALRAYGAEPWLKTVRIDPKTGGYRYKRYGLEQSRGGLLRELRRRFYDHYRENEVPSGRGLRAGKGSTKERGCMIDRQMLAAVRTGKKPPRQSRYTKALMDYWAKGHHILVAAQLPVEVPGWNRFTQADVITRNPMTGETWLWEVKSGMPPDWNFFQGNFAAPLQEVACTRAGMWQLQLHYTRCAVEAAGIPIDGSAVIQVYEAHRGALKVDIHEPPPWTGALPQLPQ